MFSIVYLHSSCQCQLQKLIILYNIYTVTVVVLNIENSNHIFA
jgi:hypothetical protein